MLWVFTSKYVKEVVMNYWLKLISGIPKNKNVKNNSFTKIKSDNNSKNWNVVKIEFWMIVCWENIFVIIVIVIFIFRHVLLVKTNQPRCCEKRWGSSIAKTLRHPCDPLKSENHNSIIQQNNLQKCNNKN